MESAIKGVYWLSMEPAEVHQAKVAKLLEFGFSVSFFKTLDALTTALKTDRVSILMIGDEGPEVIILKAITLLGRMPDIQGAKLLLSCSRFSSTVLRAAACEGFRDILAIGLHDDDWIFRFRFSVGDTFQTSHDVDAQLQADLKVTCGAKIILPARIVWVHESQLFLESRIHPEIGSPLQITGPLAQSAGVKSLSVTVLGRESQQLHYRFSVGVLCKINGLADDQKILDNFANSKELSLKPRIRTFIAVQSPALRNSLIRHLDPETFDVHAALQKKSLTDEPRFFSPNLVIIEDRLVCDTNRPRFAQMIKELPKSSKILIIGDELLIDQVHNLCGGRKIYCLKRIPMNLKDYILEQIVTKLDILEDAPKSFIPSNHEFSLAEIKISGTIDRINESSISCSFEQALGSYGLVRIESKILQQVLGRNPYCKLDVVKSTPNSDPQTPPESSLKAKTFYAASYFCDINASSQQKLAQLVKKATSQQLDFSALGEWALESWIDSELTPILQQDDDANDAQNLSRTKEHIAQETTKRKQVAQKVGAAELKKSGLWTIVFAILGFILLSVLLFGFYAIAPYWETSGGEFSKALKEFRNNAP